MEVLRNLLREPNSGLIRLAVAVGIIAAVGIFLLKPALDSADHAVDRSSEASEKIFQNNGTGLSEISKAVENVNKQVQVQIQHSFHVVKVHGGPAEPKKLIRCVKHAQQDVTKLERCARKY